MDFSPRFHQLFVIELGRLFGFCHSADNTEYIVSNIVLLTTFSFPCSARGSFEMRNYIISSIANVIRRYRAAAVDMYRMDIDSPSFQWHVQLCAVVQPAGDAHQRRHGGLLTTVVNANGSSSNLQSLQIGNSLSLSMARFLKQANERLFVETTGSSCQLCPTQGSSGSHRVS
jgi:hypothetical protein